MASSEGERIIEPAIEWIPGTITSLIATILTLRILSAELRIRKEESVKFTTKSLEYSSVICIVTGFITNLFFLLNECYGFCHFSTLMANIVYANQLIFMGLYQLSRLYYCFANDSIHSHKGYPRYVFIIMVTFGILLIITWPIVAISYTDTIYSKCGINSQFEFYYIPIKTYSFSYRALWVIAVGLIYIAWDISTLFLYYFKIRAFRDIIKNKNESIYKRVVTILYKIFIMTMFYECVILSFTVFSSGMEFVFDTKWVLDMVQIISFNTQSVCVSFAMYLMMEHNQDKYVKFLRVIRKLRLYWLCCCCGCRRIVIEQLNGLDIPSKFRMTSASPTTPTAPTDDEVDGEGEEHGEDDSIFETCNNSLPDQKLEWNGMELSVESTRL